MGKLFFAVPLSADQALVDVGRYLYFEDEYSKLWFYPASGAFEWRRKNVPDRVDFETNEDVPEDLREMAASLITETLGTESHPAVTIRYEDSRKVVVHSGTTASGGLDYDVFVRRVDLVFRQSIAGFPVVKGASAVVSFCGSMEICRVEVLMREVEDVSFINGISQNDAVEILNKQAGLADGSYHVSGLDDSREAVMGFALRSNSYYQRGAALWVFVPVIKSGYGVKSAQRHTSSDIGTPVVSDFGRIEGARRMETTWSAIPNSEQIIPELPEECVYGSNSDECAP